MRKTLLQLIGLIVLGFVLLFFALPWGYFGLQMPFSGKEYKLGLDLQGGIELDYKVDLTELQAEEDYNAQRKNQAIEGLKSIIDKRIETLGINDSVITSASYAGEEHIIVQIPMKGNDSLQNTANIEAAKAAIGRVVKIEFREQKFDFSQQEVAERKVIAEDIYSQLKVFDGNITSEMQRFYNSFDNLQTGETENIQDLFESEDVSISALAFNVLDNDVSNTLYEVTDLYGNEGYLVYEYKEEKYNYLFVSKEPSSWMAAVDSQGRVLNDKYFTKASVQYSEGSFQPMVELTFNNEGASIFGDLTKRLTGQAIAIFVGGELLTAPTVNEAILTGRAVITGQYTPEEASKLAQDINTGVVPAPIYLTSERTIDARLGQNALQGIILAGLIGFSTILIFLCAVYRLAGFVAAVALFLYVVIVLLLLKQFGAVLTLATIGGLVLSIGIAIDANILIFERIKDELRHKATLKNAVETGFNQSFSAIWDANVTGLIVALILFIFGINMIKGFGFILALGIFVSLASVYFISRIFLNLLAKSMDNSALYIGVKNNDKK